MWVRHIRTPEDIGAVILMFVVLGVGSLVWNTIKESWQKRRKRK